MGIVRNWKRWFKSYGSKITLAMDVVMALQTVLVFLAGEYPTIKAWGYEIITDYTLSVLFVIWPSTYIVLELGLLIAIPFENIGLPIPMIFFYRAFMFLHFLYASVMLVTGSLIETNIHHYGFGHLYTISYIILTLFCLCILVLLVIEDEM